MRRVEARLILLCLAVVLLAGRAAAQASRQDIGEKYALLVGVRQYDKNELRSLPYSESDVLEMARVLKDAGYRSENIIVMTQTAGAEESRFLPLGANIRKELRLLLRQRDRSDSVLIAFAGHGIEFRDSKEPFFCPMDAHLGDKSTLIALNEVYRELGQCKAGLKLLLVDACRNDPQSDHSRARSQVDLESVTRPQGKEPPPGVVALFSCAAGQKAYENDRLKHGVFFNFVIEGLRGKADLDGDRRVVLAELELYTAKRVKDFVRSEYGEEQTPIARHREDTLPLLPLVSLGQAARGMLGVTVQSVSPLLAAKLGLVPARGVVVLGNLPGQAGEKAGLRPGDVILAVNEVEIRDVRHFHDTLASLLAGSGVTVELLRGESRLQVKATLGEKPSAEGLAGLYRQAAERGESWAQYHLGRLYAQGEGVAQSDQTAATWYRRAAEGGFANAQYSLGWGYANGHGVEKDDAVAAQWLEKAARQGHANAQNFLGVLYQLGRGVTKDPAEAVNWYRKAAEQDEAVAQNNLAFMYETGQGVARDLAQAVHWYRKAAEKGYIPAQTNLGFMYENGRGIEKDFEQAVRWYRQAAEHGQPRGLFCLASMYEQGRGVPRDAHEAGRHYREAAEKNFVAAQYKLGVLYASGQGVTKDEAEAVRWYRKAAEHGSLQGQLNLGLMYELGRGVEKDEAEAVKWYRQAAEKGYVPAQTNLGWMYEHGRGVERDLQEALKWYRKAAERGQARGQFSLGLMYADGRGVRRDDVEAVAWYRKSAAQGFLPALNNLGFMYEQGRGLEADPVEACRLYRQAAERGLPVAQKNLGWMYENGKGVARDIQAAVQWYRKAAAQGNPDARKHLERLAAQMEGPSDPAPESMPVPPAGARRAR